MADETLVCNLALSNIGKPTIVSIDDATPEARACKLYYQHVLKLMLNGFAWTFARKVETLAEIANTKPMRWSHAFALPDDCLSVRSISNEYFDDQVAFNGTDTRNGQKAYAIEGTTLFCNLEVCYLEYTRYIDEEGKFPPLFVEAFAWYLAVRLAMPLTRDPKLRADAYQMATSTFAQATAEDANTNQFSSDYRSEFIQSRMSDV